MIPCFATARTATRTRAAGMASSWCWRSALRCASSCSRVSWFVPPAPPPRLFEFCLAQEKAARFGLLLLPTRQGLLSGRGAGSAKRPRSCAAAAAPTAPTSSTRGANETPFQGPRRAPACLGGGGLAELRGCASTRNPRVCDDTRHPSLAC